MVCIVYITNENKTSRIYDICLTYIYDRVPVMEEYPPYMNYDERSGDYVSHKFQHIDERCIYRLSDRHALENIESAICVQRFDDSLSSAIRTTYRSLLRSSSMHEPRDPPLKVVIYFWLITFRDKQLMLMLIYICVTYAIYTVIRISLTQHCIYVRSHT